jgi:signal transduction histidine kinase/CheY-like chemotaxis protein
MNIFFLNKIGTSETDSEEDVLQKNFMLYLGTAMSVGGILWGSICLSLGLYLQCSIPYGYAVITIINFYNFYHNKNFNTTRFVQVLISLLLPFAFQFVMGGFISSGGVMLWSIISLITALTFIKFRNAFYWLILYFIFTLLIGYLDKYCPVPYEPTRTITTMFFVINITVISSIVFGLSYFFINSRKSAIKNAEEAKKVAEVASGYKSEFLANMSHEIRTPLNGIIGFLDILKNTNLDTSQASYLSTVENSANSLLAIVNDILDFSKIETGNLSVHLDTIDLKKLCPQIIDIATISAQSKKIDLSTSIEEDIPTLVMADELRLRQVLVNLIGNAIKFTDNGAIELSIDIISKQNDIAIFRFGVRDTGVGIETNNQEKIFNAFTQEDASITKKYGGTGLGLTISNSLLLLMNSKLQLQSKVGEGSFFYFDIELKILPEDTLQKEVIAEVKTKKVFEKNNFKILIAEDNKVNMVLCKLFLKEIAPNATLIEASNGVIALEQFKNEQPQIIFMDMQMPEMNGIDAAKTIRDTEQHKRTPIIALTAGATLGEKEKCIAAGMDDYITKPFTKDTLYNSLVQWVN